MTRKHHLWSEDEVETLRQTVEGMEPLLDHYRGQATKGGWWDAVAGVVYQKCGITVTGKACQRKFADIHPEPVKEDAWAHVAAKVEAYERDLAEATYDVADETRRAVLTICHELGVAVGNDQVAEIEAVMAEVGRTPGRTLADDVRIKITSLVALVRDVRDLATTVCDAPEIVEAVDRATTGEAP